ncbi:MAG: hypothetical protein ACLUOI_39130 [Eisenbergiella sp.]
MGGSVTCLYSADGEELWRYDGSIESQHIALGKFLPESRGCRWRGLTESAGATAIRASGTERTGCSFWTAAAGEVWKEDRKTSGWLTIS